MTQKIHTQFLFCAFFSRYDIPLCDNICSQIPRQGLPEGGSQFFFLSDIRGYFNLTVDWRYINCWKHQRRLIFEFSKIKKISGERIEIVWLVLSNIVEKGRIICVPSESTEFAFAYRYNYIQWIYVLIYSNKASFTCEIHLFKFYESLLVENC